MTAICKPTARDDVVRFEINRSITGMDAHRYRAGDDIEGASPPDEVARRLLARDGVEAVHVYSNVITVDLGPGVAPDGLQEEIESLFTYYRDGVEVEAPEATPAAD